MYQHAIFGNGNVAEGAGGTHFERLLGAFAISCDNTPFASKLPVQQHVARGTLVEAVQIVYPSGDFAAHIPHLHEWTDRDC